MISRIWRSQEIKTVFTKVQKETGLADKEALENADFQLILNTDVAMEVHSQKIGIVWKLRHFGYTMFTSTWENHSRESTENSHWWDGKEFPAQTIRAQWE